MRLSVPLQATIALIMLVFTTPCLAQDAEGAISLHIFGPTAPVRPGEPIKVEISVKNISDAPISILPGRLGFGRLGFLLQALDKTGSSPPYTCYGRAVFYQPEVGKCFDHLIYHPRPPMLLAPDEIFHEAVDLSDLFEFPSGKFTIMARIPAELSLDEGPAPTISNMISITVFGQRVPWSG